MLDVKNLKTYFYTDDGIIPAVDGIDFSLSRGETLGIVGESGCGKSVTALSIMGLIPTEQGRIESGKIIFEGKDLIEMSNSEIRKIRGNRISMIFQEPMTSLNPVFTVGDQIMEAIILHRNMDREAARNQTIELLRLVGIPSPEVRINEYPFQMSGGMRQRIMIAMAISTNPSLLIADEPTTALDVTIQAQVLDLLSRLKDKLNMSIMLITHDLGVVVEVVSKIVVFYAGKIVEEVQADVLFSEAGHPYTVGLLGSIPRLDVKQNRLDVIEGNIVNPLNMPQGCRFNPRCIQAMDICREKEPGLFQAGKNHKVRCWRYDENST